MPTRTKAELLAENERLQKRVAALERAKAKSAAASKEIRQLRADLLESEQQQTATAEILRIISESPTDTQPVFDAIVKRGARLFVGLGVVLRLIKGDYAETVARFPDWVPEDTNRVALGIESRPAPRAMLRREVVQIPDSLDPPDWANAAHVKQRSTERGWRAVMSAPLVREEQAIGAINVIRATPGAFTDKEVALLQTFANQAVIAIENVRLFNETKEALERQTASSEILASISHSIADTQPVFDAIVSNVLRLFGTRYAAVFMLRGDQLDLASLKGEAHFENQLRSMFPQPLDPHTLTGRVLVSGQVGQLAPIIGNPEASSESVELARRFGYNSMIIAPMVANAKVIGAIATAQREAIRFDDKQVALLKTFADQAVIAIENVRLLKELQARNTELTESLEQQTATSDILRVISSSPTDVMPVLDMVACRAAQLCESLDARICLVEGDTFRYVAGFGEFKGVEPTLPLRRSLVMGRAIIDRTVLHIEDLAAVLDEFPDAREIQRQFGQRTSLAVPLVRENKAFGGILLRRKVVRPFSTRQIDLVKTFADQAVIAIENVRLFKELQARNAEITEALEQQTATADILRVISGSPTDVQPVFDAVAESAARLCAAHDVVIRLVGVDGHYAVAHHGSIPVLPPYILTRANLAGRAITDARTVHVPDVTEAHVREEYPESPAGAQGVRTFLAVPLLREGKAIGLILMRRLEVNPFTDKQIQLLETFAAQAVIAIENVRLFNETREALEQQTVISEILRVISNSPTDVQPVFDAIVNSASHLFSGIHEVSLRLVQGDLIETVASTLHDTFGTNPAQLDDESMPAPRALRRREVVQIPDILAAEEWVGARAKQRAGQRGWRSLLGAPLVRENNGIGAIVVTRVAPGPFTDKQIALLKTFADQAVIAIENVRLFKELAARNAEITEALEQQTATSEILRVISSSPTDTQPVFDAILENATRLCDAHSAALRLYEGGQFRSVAQRGISPEYARWIAEEAHKYPTHPDGGPYSSVGTGRIGRLLAEGQPAHILDRRESPSYRAGNPFTIALVELEGVRTFLAVPMLKEGQVMGAIVVHRREVRAFTQNQIELLSTFADQAVIAIENVRLFRELEARTDSLARSVAKLTALGEVGQAISSTLDLETVLETIVSRAVELSGQDAGVIYEYDPAAEQFELRAAQNFDAQSVAGLRGAAIRKGVGAVGTCVVTREPTQVPDTHVPDYPARLREILDLAGFRAVLAVPLLREDQIIGALMVIRKTPGPFSAEVVQLLETFASQSALAIQNARLFREIADKGRQLEVASRHKSDFLASMSHELRTPLNAILGFIELILDQIYGEVPDDMQEPLNDIQASGKHLLRLINNVLDLAKIEAGRMELALAEYSVQDTVEGVRQTLRPLAADKGLEFLATVPPELPFAHGDPGRITQCLMNLAGNSLKFTKAGKVEISVEQQGERLVFRVADTGIGIAPDKIDSLFTEFKQTDATIAGEYGGTGLGLSISRKFVEMHGGRIWVESELGRGSTFVFELPLRAGEPT